MRFTIPILVIMGCFCSRTIYPSSRSLSPLSTENRRRHGRITCLPDFDMDEWSSNHQPCEFDIGVVLVSLGCGLGLRIHSALFPRKSTSHCSTQSCTCGFFTSVSPLLNALYPSRNKQVVSPCQSLTSLTFVFNKATLAQCDNKGRLHRRKRDERPQKWYAVFFSFVSVRLTTHYRNKSPLRHGRNYPTGCLPMFKHEHGRWCVFLRELPFIHLVLGIDTETLAVAISFVPRNGEGLRPRCVSFISEHGEGVATHNPCLIHLTYLVPQQLNGPSP